MATSFNKMIEGSKLYPGYEFLATVEIFSENVVLVTGHIGSRKYRGALLSVPTNTIRSIVSDNVFNSDFSAKTNFSLSNMSVTNYYSHKKLRNSDVTMFSVNNTRAKENYICANCKMKISYITKKETKSPPISFPSQPNPCQSKSHRNSRSDITVLKQTLSYPDIISDDILPSISFVKEHQQPISAPSNCSDRNSKSFKRKKEHSNHIVEKKPRPILSNSDNTQVSNLSNIMEESDSIESIQNQKKEVTQENNETSRLETTDKDNKTILIENEIESEIVDEETPNQREETTSTPSQLYEEYRSMPLSLSKLNHVNSNDNDKTNDDSVNRECPKPKKIWMKMIENEDIEKVNIDPSSSSPLLSSFSFLPNSETIQSPLTETKSHTQSKSRHKNRSYKIKQTLHDKVILTVDKRPDKQSHHNRISEIQPLFPPSVDDIYAFSEESEISFSNNINININNIQDIAQEISVTNHDSFSKFIFDHKLPSPSPSPPLSLPTLPLPVPLPPPPPPLPPPPLIISSVNEIKNDDSLQSIHSSSSSSSSKTSSKSKKSKKSNLSDKDPLPSLAVNQSEQQSLLPPLSTIFIDLKPPEIEKITIKMEPDSTTDSTDNNLLIKETDHFVSTVITCCDNISGVTFNLGDIVWAKITGYPFWPAKIISFSQEDDTFVACIEWYAWNEISFIKINNLFHFHSNFPSKYQKRNRNGKYQEAVKLAKFDCGMIDVPISAKPISDENDINTNSIKGSDTESESNAASYTSASL